jgi:radical SAM protein (TIGR01212 family)
VPKRAIVSRGIPDSGPGTRFPAPPGSAIMEADPAVPELPYTSYSRYLTRTHGCRVYRVSVDAGFSCPNRANRSSPGCSYCAEDGARAPYLAGASGVEEQVTRAVAFLSSRYGAQDYILYFQAFSGTNAPVGKLARIYDSALGLARFRELIVSTRPDCVDEGKAALIGSYRSRGLDVWVELGLQSAHDATLERLGRGHTVQDFREAYGILKAHGLKIAVHLILGLPGETMLDMEETADFIAGLDPDGVKIHNLHIPSETPISEELLKGEITAPGPMSHLEYTIAVLERMPPASLVMRLTCDTPKNRLLAPRAFLDKQAFAARLAAEMLRRKTRQGRLYHTTPG